jgi:arylsulfatase A-like enzyme
MLTIHGKFGVVLLSLALLTLSSACRKADRDGFHTIRLMDRLKKENIGESYLAGLNGTERERFVPINSIPLIELGTGENPYGVKRKIDLGIVEIDMLFAPPKSEYGFNLRIPEGGVLEFSTGIIRDKNFEILGSPFPAEAGGVNFQVQVELGSRKRTVFQKFVPLPPVKEERTLEIAKHKVPLPNVKGEVRIILSTEGEGRAFSFWHNPVVYTAGRKTRGVILISVDTLRADHLHTYGYERPTTPNLDALAADGVVFDKAYSSSSWTLPAHVSLLTSLFGMNHGVYNPDEKIDASLITLAEMLRLNNFFCAAVTGGGFVSSFYGFSRGFETYNKGDGAVNHNNSAELVARTASNWLEDNKDKNFFLFLHTYQTHLPYECPAPYNSMFLDEDALWQKLDFFAYLKGKASVFKELPDRERRNVVGLYDGEIRYTDESLVKTLIEKLKALNLYDETLIILTSDHGEEFYEHGAWLHGAHLYEESIRIPLVIKFPGSRNKGARVDNIVRIVDIMPTVLDVMGVEAKGLSLDGRSLIPVVSGRDKGDRTFWADTCWLLLEGCGGKETAGGGEALPHTVTTNEGRSKFILNRSLGPKEMDYYRPLPAVPPAAELYDLSNDAVEKRNLVSQKPEVANRLARMVRELYAGGPKKRPSKSLLNKELEEQLRTLGYIK